MCVTSGKHHSKPGYESVEAGESRLEAGCLQPVEQFDRTTRPSPRFLVKIISFSYCTPSTDWIVCDKPRERHYTEVTPKFPGEDDQDAPPDSRSLGIIQPGITRMKTKTFVVALVATSINAWISIAALQAAPNIHHVRAGGSGDGSTWANAGGDLQFAIDKVANTGGGQVWVAEGVYLPTSFPNGGMAAQEKHFSLANGVKIYGRFPLTGDPVFSDRDPALHLTVCSGDLGAGGDPRDNAYHVFYHPRGLDLDSSARLDGFTIRDGNANAFGDHEKGGGMFNDRNAPLVVRCVFTANEAASEGGAMANLGASPILVNCVFTGNTAVVGGAIFNFQSSPAIFNTVFFENTASRLGGAMFNESESEPLLGSCTIFANGAKDRDGGGGLYNDDSTPRLDNTILWDNVNGQVMDVNGSDSVLNYCIIQDGWSGSGSEILSGDPLFVDNNSPSGPDGFWATNDDGLRLRSSSPGFESGKDADLPADIADINDDGDTGEALPLDLRMGLRVGFKELDRGAYEVRRYIVSFDPGSHGTEVGGGDLTQPVAEGDAAEAPLLAVEFGWLFTGWDKTFDDVQGDMTVAATYMPAFGPGDVCHIRQGGTGSGTSWDDAAGDLQRAIDVMHAAGGGSVWVAEGTYRPNSHPGGGTTAREMHFSLRNGVVVLGGFPPTGNPAMSNRQPWTHRSILSGDIGTPGNNSDNVYHVFLHTETLELDATAVLDGFVVTGGYADGSAPADSGAGIFNKGASPMIRRCHFVDNLAANMGGAMLLTKAQPGVEARVVNCVFTGNQAESGGGIHINMASAHFANCIFASNGASLGGAAYIADDSGGFTVEFHNSTFTRNKAAIKGPALYNEASPHLVSSILWNNQTGEIADEGSSRLDHCIIQGGWSGVGSDNIDADPLFANPSDPDGPDGIWGTTDDGLIPDAGGPAIDGGSNSLIPLDLADIDGDGIIIEPLPLDFAGNPRKRGARVDRGAYEPLIPLVFHVRAGGTGDGFAWSSALGDLQDAIEAAADAGNSQVWVAQGTYVPSGYPNGLSDPRDKHFSLRNNVSVFGGFPPAGDPGFADRDPTAYPTVCSGEVGVSGHLDNLYHVFYHPIPAALDKTALLDGVTITRGSASNTITHPHSYGAGMFNSLCSPTLVRCVFIDNVSASQAGALYLGHSTSQVVNCAFEFNRSTEGGAVFLFQSEARFANCVFYNNSATGVIGSGGAVHSFLSAACQFANCTFVANSAGWTGGAFYTDDGLVGVANSILWSNSPNQADGSPPVTFDYCSLQQSVIAGSGNFVADPQFVNPSVPTGPDGVWFTADDGLRLPVHSIAVNAGSTAALPPDAVDLDGDGNTTEMLPLDPLGLPRAIGGIPEAGAYEMPPAGMSLAYWRSLHFSAPDRADPAKQATVWGDTADLDGDGVPNMGEYLLLLDPAMCDSPLANVTVIDYLGIKWLSFDYTIGKHRPGVIESVKTSTTLGPGSWSPTGFMPMLIDETAESVTYRVLVPINEPRRFVRLEFNPST